MAVYGYKLMSEEHGPRALVRNACAAEQAGFDFVAISDHYYPWLESQGHSPLAWTVLGAIAARTERIGLATAVTCPTIRYHPALVAQFAATLAVLSDGRFTLGLGGGELLNEHVVGLGWPPPRTRHAMLGEAIDVMRLLWEGRTVSYDGAHVTVERARIWDVPDRPLPIAVAAGGPKAARLAGEKGAGLFATEPRGDLVQAWKDSRYRIRRASKRRPGGCGRRTWRCRSRAARTRSGTWQPSGSTSTRDSITSFSSASVRIRRASCASGNMSSRRS